MKYIIVALIVLFVAEKSGLVAIRAPSSCIEEIQMSSLMAPPKPKEVGGDIIDVKKINDLLPSEIRKGESGVVVINKIADKGFQNFLTSDQFRETPLGTLNEQVKEQTRIEMKFKPDQNSKLEHRLNAQLQPFQGGATLSYRGILGVDVSYLPRGESQSVKIEEEIFRKKIYYENSLKSSVRTDQIGVKWDW